MKGGDEGSDGGVMKRVMKGGDEESDGGRVWSIWHRGGDGGKK